MLESLAAAMATNTTGYIAVIDGVMNPATFSAMRNESARAALIVKTRRMVLNTCVDPETCDCMVSILGQMFPDVKIVPVDVTERKA